jgi:hypothetical protein
MTASATSVADSVQNVGAWTPQNPMGLHGLLQGYLYLFLPLPILLVPF